MDMITLFLLSQFSSVYSNSAKIQLPLVPKLKARGLVMNIYYNVSISSLGIFLW